MKHIIIEGPDRGGKNSLIKSLCDEYDYDNVSIRHFGKPPSTLNNEEAIDFQFSAFGKELNLLHNFKELENSEFYYFPNIVIWNRSHLGEYVYGSIYRNADKKYVLNLIKNFEKFLFEETSLITLTGDPEFFLSNEDGNSFSQNLEDKTKEVKLFKEIHSLSAIKNKKEIVINNKNNSFRKKEDVLEEAIDFLKPKPNPNS